MVCLLNSFVKKRKQEKGKERKKKEKETGIWGVKGRVAKKISGNLSVGRTAVGGLPAHLP